MKSNEIKGLPPKERFMIKRVLIPIVRILFTWDIALILLKREVRIIKKLIEKLDTNQCVKQVIISRTFAIENSSRKFSVNMVLEHLNITGALVLDIIETLSQEKEYLKRVEIEDVKPFENKKNQIKEFLLFYETYFMYIENHNKKYSSKTKEHPWFETFNNYDWSIFMYMHTFIHRRQLEAIIKEINE